MTDEQKRISDALAIAAIRARDEQSSDILAVSDRRFLLAQIDKRDDALRKVAQWDGDKTSIMPARALKHYANMARQVLGEME